MSEMIRQFELRDTDGTTLVCWLPVDIRVHRGSRIELKELPGRIWTVTDVYGAHVATDVKRGWNNNI
jgi:hypothetical protein